jgi:hypothetical protein
MWVGKQDNSRASWDFKRESEIFGKEDGLEKKTLNDVVYHGNRTEHLAEAVAQFPGLQYFYNFFYFPTSFSQQVYRSCPGVCLAERGLPNYE